MGDEDRGRKLLKDLAGAIRARTAPTGDTALNQRGLAQIEAMAKDLTGPDGMPGLRLWRDAQERFRLQRDKRNAELTLAWERPIGAISLAAERNGTRARAIHYVFDEAASHWRRMEGTGELYDDLAAALTEYLYPEAREG